MHHLVRIEGDGTFGIPSADKIALASGSVAWLIGEEARWSYVCNAIYTAYLVWPVRITVGYIGFGTVLGSAC
jgi:hypothetical protein